MNHGRTRGPHRRNRLACLVASCIVPVWLAAGWLVGYSYQDKRRLIDQQTLATAHAMALLVDREMANIAGALSALATSPALTSGDLATFHRQALEVLRDHPGADIILADASGQQLVNSYREFGTPLPRRNAPETVRHIFAGSRLVISDLFLGAVTGHPLVSFDVPVTRDGRVIYDLAMTVPADPMVAVLSQQPLPADWTAALLDRNGVVVGRTTRPDEFVGKPANESLRRVITRFPEGLIEGKNLEGVEVFDGFSRAATSGWTVVAGVPAASLRAQLGQWLAWTVGGGIVLSVAQVALALAMAQRIRRSIQSLVEPAAALGRGTAVSVGPTRLAETDEVASALEQASELLRRRAAERDEAERALAEHERLMRHQAEELAQSNAELQQFAYVASHDLREPLRMVGSYVALLERRYADKLDDDARTFIGFAKDGAQRMDRLIVDLLDYARVGRGSQPRQPVALAEAVATAVANLELAIADAHAEVTVAKDLPVVTGVPGELIRLFQNLIGNAVKYRHPDRPPVVRVGCRRDGADWVLSVEDNGIGIADEDLQRIFGLFQRLHSRQDYEGTGIGLAVCKKIVEQHGGRLWVRSRPGVGSEFLLTLPTADPAYFSITASAGSPTGCSTTG